jgi:hypothetical protein
MRTALSHAAMGPARQWGLVACLGGTRWRWQQTAARANDRRKGGRALSRIHCVLTEGKISVRFLGKTVRGLLRPPWRAASKGNAFGGNATRVCFA